MAELFPDEGMDLIIACIPKNGTNYANMYVGLFTSQTASTVPGASAVLATQTGVTEHANSNGYARQTIAAASWGATASGGGGRQTAGPQVTFTATGNWTAVNGFFLATSATIAAGVAFLYANFDDTTARTLVNGDRLLLTPTWRLLG